jgi:hypothetical protein
VWPQLGAEFGTWTTEVVDEEVGRVGADLRYPPVHSAWMMKSGAAMASAYVMGHRSNTEAAGERNEEAEQRAVPPGRAEAVTKRANVVKRPDGWAGRRRAGTGHLCFA